MSILLCRAARLGAAGRALAAAFALLALSPAAFAHEFKVGAITIGHPWSRATPPSATTGAGYLTLRNDGAGDDTLLSARSPAAPDVQIHEMKVENGIMTMRRLEGGLAVPAGRTVELAPGAAHLMLVGLAKPFKEGDSVPLTLVFAKAGSVDVTLHVDKLGAAAPATAGGMEGHAMEGMTH